MGSSLLEFLAIKFSILAPKKFDVPTNLLYNFLLEVTVEGEQMQFLLVAPKIIIYSQPDCPPLLVLWGAEFETALAAEALVQG